MAEPIQGNGGIIVPGQDYFRIVYAAVKKAGGLFIVDETQSGFGRTGKKFAIEHYGVEPDIVCGGKALGAGTPIGFFSASDGIAQCYRRPGASTFGGNPVTAEAGIKFLEILIRDGLVEAAAVKGRQMQQRLTALQQKFSEVIADVRGKGLMWGIELIDPQLTLTDLVMEQAKDQGLLIGKTGPDLLTACITGTRNERPVNARVRSKILQQFTILSYWQAAYRCEAIDLPLSINFDPFYVQSPRRRLGLPFQDKLASLTLRQHGKTYLFSPFEKSYSSRIVYSP